MLRGACRDRTWTHKLDAYSAIDVSVFPPIGDNETLLSKKPDHSGFVPGDVPGRARSARPLAKVRRNVKCSTSFHLISGGCKP